MEKQETKLRLPDGYEFRNRAGWQLYYKGNICNVFPCKYDEAVARAVKYIEKNPMYEVVDLQGETVRVCNNITDAENIVRRKRNELLIKIC